MEAQDIEEHEAHAVILVDIVPNNWVSKLSNVVFEWQRDFDHN